MFRLRKLVTQNNKVTPKQIFIVLPRWSCINLNKVMWLTYCWIRGICLIVWHFWIQILTIIDQDQWRCIFWYTSFISVIQKIRQIFNPLRFNILCPQKWMKIWFHWHNYKMTRKESFFIRMNKFCQFKFRFFNWW